TTCAGGGSARCWTRRARPGPARWPGTGATTAAPSSRAAPTSPGSSPGAPPGPGRCSWPSEGSRLRGGGAGAVLDAAAQRLGLAHRHRLAAHRGLERVAQPARRDLLGLLGVVVDRAVVDQLALAVEQER